MLQNKTSDGSTCASGSGSGTGDGIEVFVVNKLEKKIGELRALVGA